MCCGDGVVMVAVAWLVRMCLRHGDGRGLGRVTERMCCGDGRYGRVTERMCCGDGRDGRVTERMCCGDGRGRVTCTHVCCCGVVWQM
jgi:hypothetical protein